MTWVSPGGVWVSLLAVPACIVSAFALGTCFAPHLIASWILNIPQAIHRSLFAWRRNPVAFLTFVGMGTALIALRVVARWIGAIVLFPLPRLAMVLGKLSWAAAVLCYAAALFGLGCRALDTGFD